MSKSDAASCRTSPTRGKVHFREMSPVLVNVSGDIFPGAKKGVQSSLLSCPHTHVSLSLPNGERIDQHSGDPLDCFFHATIVPVTEVDPSWSPTYPGGLICAQDGSQDISFGNKVWVFWALNPAVRFHTNLLRIAAKLPAVKGK